MADEREPLSITHDDDEQPRSYLYRDCNATVTYPNTDTYAGAYVNRLKHAAIATYKFNTTTPRPAQYDGAYEAGQRHGQGTISYPDGSTYSGGWVRGKREGWGKYTYRNGDIWVGEWKDGKKEGDGVYIYKMDGSQLEGRWQAGQCADGVWSYYAGQERKAEVRNNTVTRYL